MAKLIMKVEGADGQIELLEDRVVINRSGIFALFVFGSNSRREIPIGALSEVSFKNASLLSQGQIEFIRSGSSANSGNKEKSKVNHNAVKFIKKQQAEFEALKEKIFELINQHHSKK